MLSLPILLAILTVTSDPLPVSARGLFLASSDLDRAKIRISDNAEPFSASISALLSKVQTYRTHTPDWFAMTELADIRFGWREEIDGVDDTLWEAVMALETESDVIRTLAYAYALGLDDAAGQRAVGLMLSGAEYHQIINLYDFTIDFQAGTLETANRTLRWNFALDALWQGYGLINIADSYLLLRSAGYELSAADEQRIENWILMLSSAVNASLHAWTKWADLHPNASSYERYRTDNHLSWANLALLAAAVALNDTALANYAIEGGTWDDPISGMYSNPSSLNEVALRAIEDDGTIFEELINRNPPILYAIFHLQALILADVIMSTHTEEAHGYSESSAMLIGRAVERYARFVERPDLAPTDPENLLRGKNWLFDVSARRYASPQVFRAALATERDIWIPSYVGPVALMLGEDEAVLQRIFSDGSESSPDPTDPR